MLSIQSIVISKKYELEQAEQIIKNLNFNHLYLKKQVTEYKAGETLNYYRFRLYPPSQYKRNSFKSKKVNDDLFLILGEKIK